jgi:hypothetical protein
MNQLVNSALLAYYSKTGKIKLKKSTKRRGVSTHSYDTMSELEPRELQVSFAAEQPDGTHYEYDRNLKATVKVTSDGERYPVRRFDATFEHGPQ